MTVFPGDARRRATFLGSDVGTLLVGGGDGTLNEVINGLSDPSRIPIVLLPVGTSNSLAKELDLPKRPESIAEMMEKGQIRRLDIGTVGDRRFLLGVGSGFDGMVTEEVFRSGGLGSGYGRYIFPILKVLVRYHPPELKAMVDGIQVKGGMIYVGNTRILGWILKITDRARCDSGHLDVCIFPKARVQDLLRYLPAAFFGRLSRLSDVRYLTGKTISIHSKKPIAVQMDGDYFGKTPIRIDCQKAVVPIVVP
jgi:YegS/Rv2252/BmrU family lipid kinase